MAIRKIAQMGEPVLRRRAAPLSEAELRSESVRRLIQDLIETMHDADGAGLAAPQVYESVRLCVIEVAQNRRYPGVEPIPLSVLVNPVITPLVALQQGGLDPAEAIDVYEGCLSVQGVRGRVRRPRRVRVQALDAHGEPLELIWEGFRAAVVQHETDHLDGVLFVDRADPKTLTFLREYERFVPAEARVVDRGAPVLPR